MRLHIPRHLFPDGFDLQWVTESVFGQPQPAHRARFERSGWVSVMADEFDGRYGKMFAPDGTTGEIKQDGLVLMARSKAWSDKARRLDQRRAGERVQIKVQQLRAGALDKVSLAPDHPEVVRRNVINTSIEPISISVPTQ